MTADEARKLLGVEPGADKGTVRRAYLRLLKLHKPETDPEGFQRLREAYELIERHTSANADVLAMNVSMAPVLEVRLKTETENALEIRTENALETHTENALDTGTAAVTLTETEPEARTLAEGFWERLEQLPYGSTAAQRLLEEAIVACPDDAGFYLELAAIRTEAMGPVAAVTILRDGIARGHIACAVELLHTRPGALDLETLERITPQVHFGDAARGFIALDRPQRAFELGRDAVGMERWTHRAFPYDILAALDIALGLMAAGQLGLGRELGKRTLTAGRESGAVLEAARNGGLRWALSGEFLALHPPLSNDIEEAIATSIVRGNAIAYRLAREDIGRGEGRALDARLQREAPMLDQYLASAGAPAPSFRETMTEGWGNWWVWPVAVFVLHLLRSCGDCSSCDTNRDRVDVDEVIQRAHSAQRARAEERERRSEAETLDEMLKRARESVGLLCAPPAAPTCERASFVLAAWERGDCLAILARDGSYTATHAVDADAGPEVIFGPALPPTVAALVRRCEQQEQPAP